MADINLALTMAGQVLSAKIEMGKGDLPLDITRIVTASGISADPLNLVDVVDLRQEFTITKRVRTGPRASITCVLSNYGDPANGIPPLATGYPLSQIGFYANDPDEGEILYRISQFDAPNYVPASTERGWTFEPTFNFVVGNASKVVVQIDPSGYVTRHEFDELVAETFSAYLVDGIFSHNLNAYPSALVIEFDSGYGVAPYGMGSYGGSNGRQVRNRVEFLSRNSVKLFTSKSYGAVESVTEVSSGEFIVTFTGDTLSLYVQLFTGAAGGTSSPPSSGTPSAGEVVPAMLVVG